MAHVRFVVRNLIPALAYASLTLNLVILIAELVR